MIRPNSGVSWVIHHRQMWFFISHQSQVSFRIFWHFELLCFEAKSPCWRAPVENGFRDFLNHVHVCHFHGMFPFIKAIMHTILAGGTTHVAIFFAIAIAWIDLTETLQSQKRFVIVPADKLFEWLLVVFAQNQIPIVFPELVFLLADGYRFETPTQGGLS